MDEHVWVMNPSGEVVCDFPDRSYKHKGRESSKARAGWITCFETWDRFMDEVERGANFVTGRCDSRNNLLVAIPAHTLFEYFFEDVYERILREARRPRDATDWLGGLVNYGGSLTGFERPA